MCHPIQYLPTCVFHWRGRLWAARTSGSRFVTRAHWLTSSCSLYLCNGNGYVCMYVRMYVCVCVYVCMHVRMYVCMYVRMYVCLRMYACTYVCMYVCMCVYVCMYVRMYKRRGRLRLDRDCTTHSTTHLLPPQRHSTNVSSSHAYTRVGCNGWQTDMTSKVRLTAAADSAGGAGLNFGKQLADKGLPQLSGPSSTTALMTEAVRLLKFNDNEMRCVVVCFLFLIQLTDLSFFWGFCNIPFSAILYRVLNSLGYSCVYVWVCCAGYRPSYTLKPSLSVCP